MNGLPVSFTTQYFMWNKTVFDKAGAPIPKTWEDIVEGGKILKEKLGNEYYAMDTTRTQAMYMTHSYIFQKTGKMFVDPATGDEALGTGGCDPADLSWCARQWPLGGGEPGDRVEVGVLRLQGVIRALAGKDADVDVNGKRMRVKMSELRKVGGATMAAAPTAMRTVRAMSSTPMIRRPSLYQGASR